MESERRVRILLFFLMKKMEALNRLSGSRPEFLDSEYDYLRDSDNEIIEENLVEIQNG